MMLGCRGQQGIHHRKPDGYGKAARHDDTPQFGDGAIDAEDPPLEAVGEIWTAASVIAVEEGNE